MGAGQLIVDAGQLIGEETNIDVLWATTGGVRTFCEVKLSEADFGKALDDDRHRAKLVDIYSEILAGHLEPARLEFESLAFFEAYQFNRSVWHVVRTDRSRLIFLLPRSNAGLWSLLQRLLSRVAPGTRERISAVAIEEVIANPRQTINAPKRLREYAGKLKHKYLIQSATLQGAEPRHFDNQTSRCLAARPPLRSLCYSVPETCRRQQYGQHKQTAWDTEFKRCCSAALPGCVLSFLASKRAVLDRQHGRDRLDPVWEV